MLRNLTFALMAALAAAATANAAPIITMTETNDVVRSQAQGGGTYKVLDFFWTNSGTNEFSNYKLKVTATAGSLFDPAKLQDDRQQGSADVANTAGPVDTFANTVMSAGAKESGFPATLASTNGQYNPTGAGAAVAFQVLDWDVFDNVLGDDNDLGNFPEADGGPFAAIAPYHIARVLATNSTGAGTVLFQAYDNLADGVPTNFNFTFGPAEVPEPATLSLFGLALAGCGIFRRRRS